MTALLDGLVPSGSHSVLDLGPARPSHLRIFAEVSPRIRFADLLTRAGTREWAGALRALPDQAEHPYDVLLLWDVLDRLSPEARGPLVARLGARSAPGARLHALVQASEGFASHPLEFRLLDGGRIRYTPDGPPRPARKLIQSATVEKILAPFRVEHAFTLSAGFREYVAVRGR